MIINDFHTIQELSTFVRRGSGWQAEEGSNDDLCLLYTSDAADEGLGVDLGGRRIIKKKIKEGSVEVVGVFVF